jgi:hypothetical protein
MELRDTRAQLQEQVLLSKQAKSQAKSAKATASSSAPSAGQGGTSDAIDRGVAQIGVYARKFGVMNEVVVSRGAFLLPQPRGINSDDPDHWKSEELALQGLVAELYEELPEDMHGMLLKDPKFRDTVCI